MSRKNLHTKRNMRWTSWISIKSMCYIGIALAKCWRVILCWYSTLIVCDKQASETCKSESEWWIACKYLKADCHAEQFCASFHIPAQQFSNFFSFFLFFFGLTMIPKNTHSFAHNFCRYKSKRKREKKCSQRFFFFTLTHKNFIAHLICISFGRGKNKDLHFIFLGYKAI